MQPVSLVLKIIGLNTFVFRMFTSCCNHLLVKGLAYARPVSVSYSTIETNRAITASNTYNIPIVDSITIMAIRNDIKSYSFMIVNSN